MMRPVAWVVVVLALVAPMCFASIAWTMTADDAAVQESTIGVTAEQEAAQLEDPELDAVTRELASQLRCPVCQGLSIQDSPTEMAEDMKLLIREQLAEGRSAEEVKTYFIGRYGEWVLLEPKAQGLNLAVYILPALGVIFGAGLIVRSVRRWVQQNDPATDPSAH